MRKRDLGLDIYKIIACIAVILIHITSDAIFQYTSGSSLQAFVIVINSLVKFAVPCFIFLSAVALFDRYRNKRLYYIDFLKQRMGVILIPFLVWSLVYYLLYVYLGYYPLSITFLIKGIVLGDLSYHLYFMIIIIQFYLIFTILKYFVERIKTAVGAPLIVIAHLVYTFKIMALIPKSDRFFMSYLIFFMAGMYLVKHKAKIHELISKYRLVLIGIYLILAATYSTAYVFIFAKDIVLFKYTMQLWYGFSLASIIIFYIISNYLGEKLIWKKNKIIELSGVTFYVYLSHPLVLLLLKYIYSGLSINSVSLKLVLNFIFIIIVCFSTAVAYNKLKNGYKKKHENNIKYL